MAQVADGLHERGVGHEVEAGDEPCRAQHPQRIVEERDLRLERRAEAARGEIGGTTVRIDQLGFGKPERHRVDGEVASRQVGLDVVGELDVGLATVGVVDVGAVRGDLHRHAVAEQADGPEALALEPHVVGPPAHELLR